MISLYLKSFLTSFLKPREPLLKWAAWFFVGNVVLFLLIGLQYIFVILPLPFPGTNIPLRILTWSYLITTYLGQLSLLALIPIILLTIPLILLCYRQRKLIFISSVCISSLAVILLFVDTTVFRQFRFHINGFIYEFVTSKEIAQIFDFTWLEYLLTGILFSIALIIETTYAVLVWKKITHQQSLVALKRYFITAIGCLLFSYYMFILGATHSWLGINKYAHVFPLYENFLSTLLPQQFNLQMVTTVDSGNFVQLKQPSKKLNYPLHPLVCYPHKKPYNIVFIAIDSWRHDMVNPTVTPNLAAFANNNWQFTQHNSGGNGTQPGIFSLFYGIPANYWTATVEQKKSPVLMDELTHQHYQFGIYASAELLMPSFNLNVFRSVKNLQVKTPGKTVYDRDEKITQQFQQFLESTKKTQQPFFSFLFYDAAHGFCEQGNPVHLFQPTAKTCTRLLVTSKTDPTPYLNRYKNSLHYIDALVARDLKELKEKNLLNNTIVIITGDHSNEFNDNHSGYWEHTGNFTRYQIQTPLLIHWPGKTANTFTQRTSHYDIVPTLLTDVLNCKNSIGDYSIGQNLFSQQKPGYLLVHSYTNFGIIEPSRITTVLPSGDSRIDDPNGHPIPNAHLHLDVLKQAFNDMRRFYTHD